MAAEIIRLEHSNPFVNHFQSEILELMYSDKYRQTLSMAEMFGVFEVIKWDTIYNERD